MCILIVCKSCNNNNAGSSRRVRHGGVCLLVKSELVDLCTDISINTVNHYDGVQWCIFGNVLLGVLYIPPRSSANLDIEIFERIQDDIM